MKKKIKLLLCSRILHAVLGVTLQDREGLAKGSGKVQKVRTMLYYKSS